MCSSLLFTTSCTDIDNVVRMPTRSTLQVLTRRRATKQTMAQTKQLGTPHRHLSLTSAGREHTPRRRVHKSKLLRLHLKGRRKLRSRGRERTHMQTSSSMSVEPSNSGRVGCDAWTRCFLMDESMYEDVCKTL